MSTSDFIIALFCKVDDTIPHVPADPRAKLAPSELVTLGLLFALKGGGQRAFHRWITANYRDFFPHLPERTRFFRLLRAHQEWADSFLAKPTVLGICDSYGVELIHPRREERSPEQLGRKGKSNHVFLIFLSDNFG